jgi:hypothetical protein
MVENLGLAWLSLGDQRLIEDVKDILANLLEFGLNLLTVLADGRYVLVGAFRFLLLLDGGDNAPGSTSGTHNILVSNREEVALIDGQFSPKLWTVASVNRITAFCSREPLSMPRTFATSFMYVTISS